MYPSIETTTLIYNGRILAQGEKIDNLFTYTALTMPKEMEQLAYYTAEPADIVLWHHRLAHTGYSTLEAMKRLKTVEGFMPDNHHGLISLCSDCPYGKQVHAPFQKTENLPKNIGDIIVSDICRPFDLSMGGHKYFITWLEMSSRLASVDFLKDKECHTITESLRKFIAWLLRQKGANIKRIHFTPHPRAQWDR